MVTTQRIEQLGAVQQAVSRWARGDSAIVAVALVGSWARNEARMDSDADVVVLCETDRFVNDEQWIAEVCGSDATLVRTVDWGALTERRILLPSGFEIEFGFAAPSWASVAPVDPGTREIVNTCG